MATAWPLARVLETGRADVVTDLEARVGALAALDAAARPHSAIVHPIAQAGQDRPTGVLVMGLSPDRALDDDYRGFIELVAQQIARSVADARTIEEERQRAEERAELLAQARTARAEAEEARAAVEVERERLHTIFQQAPALIALLSGPTHVFTFANPIYERVSGRSSAALVGRPLREALPEVSDQGFIALLDEVYRTGAPFIGTEMPVRLDRHGDGHLDDTFISFVYQASRDGGGTIDGILVLGVEVTDQVRARQRVEEMAGELRGHLALMEAMTASLGDGVYALDRDGRLTFMNPAAEGLLGWTAADLRGRAMHDAIHAQHAGDRATAADTCPLLAVMRTGAPAHVADDVFTCKDGTLLPVSYTSAPMVLEGHVVGSVVAFHDISADKALEQAREEFLSSAAHDLKGPLTSITGHAQLAQSRLDRLGLAATATVAEQLRRIEVATTRMVGQIDALVDGTRARLGGDLALDRHPNDLVALVRGVVAREEGLTAHQIVVEAAVPVLEGSVDAPRLTRVVANLVGNALKYSPDGGTVTVAIRRDEGASGTDAVMSVRDVGVGIPAADLPHIFMRFHRGANVVGRFLGTGIGLASARQIVEAHGGSVTVESEEGAGATFTVHLPLRVPTADAAGVPDAP